LKVIIKFYPQTIMWKTGIIYHGKSLGYAMLGSKVSAISLYLSGNNLLTQ